MCPPAYGVGETLRGGVRSLAREKKIYPLAEGLTTAHSYAVLGNEEKFKRHKHAWHVWRTLKEFGCTVYPVALGITRLDGFKFYASLKDLGGKVDVVIPCLLAQDIPSLVEDSGVAGAGYIWFQEQTWTSEFEEKCQGAGITPVKGCVLRHKVYRKPWGFMNPCYWHGLGDPKVVSRRF